MRTAANGRQPLGPSGPKHRARRLGRGVVISRLYMPAAGLGLARGIRSQGLDTQRRLLLRSSRCEATSRW